MQTYAGEPPRQLARNMTFQRLPVSTKARRQGIDMDVMSFFAIQGLKGRSELLPILVHDPGVTYS